jgi:anti-anti-sigma factor
MLLLQPLQTVGCESLTVDFYEVAYVDTSGLAVLLEVLRAARGLKKTFHLSGLHDRPRFLLEATRLLRLFDEVARDVEQ